MRQLFHVALYLCAWLFAGPASAFRSGPLRMSSSLSHEEVARYSRHLILSDVGVKGQERLKNARVLCVGAGGLGSPALLYLAAAGIGTIGIVDDDVVDRSNLQRQVIHSDRSVGVKKVESAASRILEINPHCDVKKIPAALSSENALDILRDFDVIVDGSDNFPTRYLVDDAAAILGKPVCYAAILAFEGQASVFHYNGGPTYRDFLPVPPNPEDVPSCAEGGVLGVLPGTMGCIQATECLKIILGIGEVLSGRILIYDALAMRFREVPLTKQVSERPDELIDYDGFCGAPNSSGGAAAAQQGAAEPSTRLSAAEVFGKLEGGWNPYVVDVRLPSEADICSLPFTDAQVTHKHVSEIVDMLPAGDRDILVYCKGGVRSRKACRELVARGVDARRLYEISGGIVEWATEVDPSMPVY